MGNSFVYSGVITIGNIYRLSVSHKKGAVHIGNVDLVKEVATNFPDNSHVTIHIGEFSSFSGKLIAHVASPFYNEDDKLDRDTLQIGMLDLIEVFDKLYQQTINFYISDDPTAKFEDYKVTASYAT